MGGKVANVILVGPGKAGTTSLFWYLKQHPAIFASEVKETRHFLYASAVDEGYVKPHSGRAAYERHFASAGDQPYRMEASPHYFHGGRPLVDEMRSVCGGDLRVIVTLREPLSRIWSVYRFAKARLRIDKRMPLSEYLDTCTQQAETPRTHENEHYCALWEAQYDRFLPDWLLALPHDHIHFTFFDDLVERPEAAVRAIYRWLGVDEGFALSQDYAVQNRSAGYRSRTLHRAALALNRHGVLRGRERIKGRLRRVYYAVNENEVDTRLPVELVERLAPRYAGVCVNLRSQLNGVNSDGLPIWLSATGPIS